MSDGGGQERPRRAPRPVRWPFRLFTGLLLTAVGFSLLLLWAYRFRNDQWLARTIADINNGWMRGRMVIGSVHWDARTLIHLAVGQPAPVRVEHFAVYDPRGERVIYVPRADTRLEVLPLATGGHLVLHGIEAAGGYCNVTAVGRPGGGTAMGLLEAFAAVTPTEGRGPRVELLDFDLRRFSLRLGFPSWSLNLDGIDTRGSFRLTGGEVEQEGVRFSLRAEARSGLLTIAGLPVPLGSVTARRFEVNPEDPMSLWFDGDLLAGGAPVTARGRLKDTFRSKPGVELALGTRGAAPLLASLISKALDGQVQVVGAINGLLGDPLISARASGIQVHAPPIELRDIETKLDFQPAAGQLRFDWVRGQGLGGRFEASGRLDLEAGDFSGTVKVQDMDPSVLHRHLAGRVNGTVKVKGLLSPTRLLLVLDLDVRRRQRDLLPPRVALKGSVHLGGTIVDLAGVTLSGSGQTLEARGSVNLRSGQMDLALRLKAPRLDQWLLSHDLPAAVRRGQAQLQVTGRFPHLRARGQVQAEEVGHDLLRIRQVNAEVRFDGQELRLLAIRSGQLASALSGEAVIDLFSGDMTQLRETPLLRARLKAENLPLSSLDERVPIQGLLTGEVEVSGPLEGLTGTAFFRAPELSYLGDRYDGAWARLGLLRDRLSIYSGELPRLGGGQIQLWGDLYYDKRLDLRLTVADFPLTGIPPVAALPLGLGGQVGGRLTVKGTLSDPRPEGEVELVDAKLRGMSLGSGRVVLTPGSDLVRIEGMLLGTLLHVQGYLLTDPRARLHLRLGVDRFPLEKLAPEIRQLGDIRGLLTGVVRLDADSRDGLTWADARLSTVEVSLRHLTPGERTAKRVELVNRDDILARYDGQKLHLVTANLVTRVPGRSTHQATFTVGGTLDSSGLDLHLDGRVATELLEFFLAGYVQKLTGEVLADLYIRGPLHTLRLGGTLDLEKITVQMPEFQRLIELPTGRFRLKDDLLLVEGLSLRVGREVLRLSGDLALAGLLPKTANLTLDGDVNMELLQLVFPEQVSLALGATAVHMRITGPVADPEFSGLLKVRRLEVSPRGWGRTITLQSGQVRFSNYLIATEAPLEGTYDEGLIRVEGEVRLDHYELVDIYLRIAGTGLPQRQPKVYSAEVNVDAILMGDSRQLSLTGDLEIVDLRYMRNFDVLKQAFIRPRIAEEEAPFWKGRPLLADLILDLQVRSMGQILVKNNLAELSASGDMAVSGTLSDPRLGGVIRVDEGTFKLPGLRGEFTINRGEVLFSRTQPMEQGVLSSSAETTFEGRNQVDYVITLTVEGPLSNPGLQLSSSPSLDQGQIWSLLAFGRTTDQLRTQFRTGDSGQGQGTQAAGAADAQVKQLTGEILSQVIEDPLKKVTRLDVISLEVGTESAQIRAGKKLGRYLNLAGEYELGLLGDNRAEGRLEVKMHDLLMLVGKWERLSTRLETENEDPNQGRIELKLKIPLR